MPTISNYKKFKWIWFLPPATKLGQGYVFTGVCDSVHWGGGSASVNAGIPPTPQKQTPPPRSRHRSRHPPSRIPPGAGTPPGSRHPLPQSMLGDMVITRAVCILLECNLVVVKVHVTNHLYYPLKPHARADKIPFIGPANFPKFCKILWCFKRTLLNYHQTSLLYGLLSSERN